MSKISKENIVEKNLWIEQGDLVDEFEAANNSIGTLVLKFNSENETMQILNNIEKYVEIRLM